MQTRSLCVLVGLLAVALVTWFSLHMLLLMRYALLRGNAGGDWRHMT